MEHPLKDIYVVAFLHKAHELYTRDGNIIVDDCSKPDFLDKIGSLHICTHSGCDCIQKTSRRNQSLHVDGEGAPKVPSPSEKLLTIKGYLGKSVFFKMLCLRHYSCSCRWPVAKSDTGSSKCTG